jgi:hypothetical protein
MPRATAVEGAINVDDSTDQWAALFQQEGSLSPKSKLNSAVTR